MNNPPSSINSKLSVVRLNDPPSLPDTMADLLETAINEARKLNRVIYQPDFRVWHSPEADDTCAICLAGSLIASTADAAPKQNICLDSFSEPVAAKFRSLDSMRMGAWKLAYHRFYGKEPSYDISEALTHLPQPVHSNFFGWGEFNKHLSSLKKAVQPLRQIEIARETV